MKPTKEKEIEDLIKVYEDEYFFDTEQERRLALRDFARDLLEQKDQQIKELEKELKGKVKCVSSSIRLRKEQYNFIKSRGLKISELLDKELDKLMSLDFKKELDKLQKENQELKIQRDEYAYNESNLREENQELKQKLKGGKD